MGYKLYAKYNAQPCRAVALFLLQNNIQFEEKEIDLLKGEQHSEEYLKINPGHKIPALDDDGWILTESVAMLRYLAAKENTPDHWYPVDIKQRARVDEFISWLNTTLRNYAQPLFRLMLGKCDIIAGRLEPYRPHESPDEEEMRKLINGVEVYLNLIENYFLKRNDFMAGNRISIADLLAIAEIQQLISIDYEISRNRPKLGAWLGKVRAVLGSDLDNINKEIMELGRKYKRNFVYIHMYKTKPT